MEKRLLEQKILELEEENEQLSTALTTVSAEVVVVAKSRDEWIAQYNLVKRELDAFRSVRFDRGSRLAS